MLFDKLLRGNYLKTFYVKAISDNLLRTGALHFKTMLLCKKTNIAEPQLDQSLHFKIYFSLRVTMKVFIFAQELFS